MNASSATEAKSFAWHALRAELYRFVARRIPPADAEDVVQESLLRIHRGLANLRSDGAIIGWIYQVTRNTLADHLRALRSMDELDDALGEPAVLSIVRDDPAFAALARCLVPFVAMLPAHYREAVELVELRGMSQVAAAAELRIPLSTMKSRVQRGRAQLRDLLERCCAIDLDARNHVVDVTPRTVCACPSPPDPPS